MNDQNQPLTHESGLPTGPFDKPSQESQIDSKQLYVHVRNQVVLHGKSYDQAEQYAIENGADPAMALRMKHAIYEELVGEKKREGRNDLIWGGVGIVAGIIITALSYSLADEMGGGYVVTYGVIIYGAVRLIRGLIKIA